MKPASPSAPGIGRIAPTLRRFALACAGWALFAFVQANLLFLWRPPDARQVPFPDLLYFTTVGILLWALMTVPILELAHRFPIVATRWATRIPLHLLGATLVHVAQAAYLAFVTPHLRQGPGAEWPQVLYGTLIFDLSLYGMLVASAQAVDAGRRAAQLRTELLEAELRVLRMQLQPHFLFNTLHAVSELVHVDPPRAERALTRLADLLRWTLQSSGVPEVPLREELAALGHYVEIQRLRLGDGVSFAIDAEPDTLPLAVPSLLLQPLVENAVRHGVRGASRGCVRVRCRRVDGRLEMAVADDGVGLAPGYREGTGLRTTRARLAGLYGAAQSLTVRPRDGGGTTVEVTLPARAAGVAP